MTEVTTRNKEVCTSIEADEIARVEPLPVEGGWQLFCCIAFPNGSVHDEIGTFARKIAVKCKGTALPINVVVAPMRNYTYQDKWKHGLHHMHKIDDKFYGLPDEIEEKTFQLMKWSCNGLQDYLKTRFVYFAAFSEDTVIYCKEVIDFWIAEDLVLYILQLFPRQHNPLLKWRAI